MMDRYWNKLMSDRRHSPSHHLQHALARQCLHCKHLKLERSGSCSAELAELGTDHSRGSRCAHVLFLADSVRCPIGRCLARLMCSVYFTACSLQSWGITRAQKRFPAVGNHLKCCHDSLVAECLTCDRRIESDQWSSVRRFTCNHRWIGAG